MLDTGCSMLDTEYSMLDTGCSMLNKIGRMFKLDSLIGIGSFGITVKRDIFMKILIKSSIENQVSRIGPTAENV